MQYKNKRFRVVKRSNIWTDALHFYPEERPCWWPFWFRFDCGGYQVFFNEECEAWYYIADYIKYLESIES